MQKPYIICHMMMAADGRIDCSIQKFEDGAVWLRYEVKNGGGK
jgi:hypothetical protein